MTNTPIEITQESFRAALVESIKEKPEGYTYVNNAGERADLGDISCDYYDERTGKGSCLIGTALLKLGVTIDQMYPYAALFANYMFRSLIDDQVIDLSVKVINAATAAQRAQDCGNTWETALSAYDNAF